MSFCRSIRFLSITWIWYCFGKRVTFAAMLRCPITYLKHTQPFAIYYLWENTNSSFHTFCKVNTNWRWLRSKFRQSRFSMKNRIKMFFMPFLFLENFSFPFSLFFRTTCHKFGQSWMCFLFSLSVKLITSSFLYGPKYANVPIVGKEWLN